VLSLALSAGAQDKYNYGALKKQNEEVLFSFRLHNNKIAVLASPKDNSYLVYRFGTAEKAELEYPAVRDKSSWKRFQYSGYWRGGGKENEALEDYSLSFKNNGIEYSLYENWYSGDEKFHVGIRVTEGKKETDIKGMVSTIVGTLAAFREMGNLIHNDANDQ